MTTIASLPVIKVWVAFSPINFIDSPNQPLPTPSSPNSYWTDVSKYVRDFSTRTGKQHYLDRVEASTLKMTLNNRDGFFNNTHQIAPRMPVAIQATWPQSSSTPYSIYFGIIDTIREKVGDQLNSDLDIEATDLTKYLSLKYLYRPSFWAGYANSAATKNWYRCNNYSSTVVTSAVGNGTSITYYCTSNVFKVGDGVTVSGLGGLATLNQANVMVTSVTANSFTTTITGVTATSTGAGVAYSTDIVDQTGTGANGTFFGQVSYPNNGVIIYDSNGCVDLAGASNQGAGVVGLPTQTGIGSLDFWILGQTTNKQLVTQLVSGGTTTVQIKVGASGKLEAWTGSTPAFNVSSGIAVNDGYWHHVGLVVVGSVTYLYCDGTFTVITGLSATSLSSSGLLFIGGDGLNPTYNGQVDEIVTSNVVSVPQAQIQQRYRAGSLLQLGFPVTSDKVISGDRIAEILTLAGWGTINNDGGIYNTCTLSVSNFAIGYGYQQVTSGYTEGNVHNGFASVEPYYWDSPITGSTALDLIQQVTETDLGSFYQTPNGTFRFDTQKYFGNWDSGTATAVTSTTLTDSTSTWTTNQWVGVILNSGTSSAIVTSNTATTLTFSGGWTGGTPALGYYWMWLPTSASAGYTWSDTSSGALRYDGPSCEVIFDDADTWTTVRITPQAGTDQIYENVTAEARWGFSTLTKSSTVSTSLADAKSTAYFLGYIYRQPLWRVNNVTLLSETSNGANLDSMLGADLGDIISFERTMPNASGANAISARMVIESITHDFVADPGTWHTSFVLDPYPVHN